MSNISQSALTKLGRAIGTKLPLEVTEDRSFREEVDMANRKKSLRIDIQVENPLSLERQRLVNDTKTFAENISLAFQNRVRDLMDEYETEDGPFTPKMKRKMVKQKEDTPRFAVKTGEAAKDFLKQAGYQNYELHQDSVLLVFNLPPITGRMWHRGAIEAWGEMSVPVEENEVEWGFFYRYAMPVVWEQRNKAYELGLDLYQVNPSGVHNHKRYYYIWEVSRDKDLPWTKE